MGIFLSLLFPRLYMNTDNPASSAPGSSRSSTSSTGLPRSSIADTPPSSFSDDPTSSLVDHPQQDRAPFSPHAVGLGIWSPQPMRGPFPPPGRPSPSPLQVRSSPTPLRQGTSPFAPLRSESPHISHDPAASEEIQLVPIPAASFPAAIDTEAPLCDVPATPSTSSRGAGLQIAIPPPILNNATSTPSPPLLPLPVTEPVPISVFSVSDRIALGQASSSATEASFFNVEDVSFPTTTDATTASTSDINLDFTEFDSDGLNALEKIYLFSRSRAGFHRVFIVHALPKYLGADDLGGWQYPSREEVEQITPADAVEYVLPLLNGLALDEDEGVKEALASELIDIIWWFITHCLVVEEEANAHPGETIDDVQHQQEPQPAPAEAGVTPIPVQAFTPILGTLLLSQNALVGAPARNAVVELLRRLWCAEERETLVDSVGVDEPRLDLETGLLGERERRLFECEILHRVVIGMGRLDLPDTEEGPLSSISTPRSGGGERRDPSQEHDLAYPMQTPPGPDTSTAGSTPLAAPAGHAADSYFPAFPLVQPTVAPASSPTSSLERGSMEGRNPMQGLITPPAFMLNLPPPSPRKEAAVNTPTRGVSSPIRSTPPTPCDAPTATAHDVTSSASPAISSSPPPGQMPASSPAVTGLLSGSTTWVPIESDTSTPSLTSSSSSSISTDSSTSLLTPSSSASTAPTVQSTLSISSSGVQLHKSDPDVYISPGAWKEDVASSLDGRITDVIDSQPEVSPNPVVTEVGSYFPALATEQRSSSEAPLSTWLSAGLPEGSPQDSIGQEVDAPCEEEGDMSEEAAMGRLSSMSLMAAVTASVRIFKKLTPVSIVSTGSLREETKHAFVSEVERVGKDPVYWVRREAAFAVGALAKVVPQELVLSSLLPLFEGLYKDHTWHVRHSVIFALPAILLKLPPHRRRSLALEVLLPLASDESPTVRSAVLESLGEVIYTFHEDADGPPRELLNLFLGVRDGRVVLNRRQSDARQRLEAPAIPGLSTSSPGSGDKSGSAEGLSAFDIFDDPSRPLVCAFNFPAVALTLGKPRWPELRELYRSLSRSPSYKVRRTLAASLGEIAKIVGPDYAREDILEVWWTSIGAEETEVRLKAIKGAATFVRALGEAQRAEVVRRLGDAFATQRLKGWREREEVVKNLPSFLDVDGLDSGDLRKLLMSALADRVSAIREAAIAVFPTFIRTWQGFPHWVAGLRASIRALAVSDAYRERTTFVTCEQSLIKSEDRDLVILDEDYWRILSSLILDPIVDVRIRVARLLCTISDCHGGGHDSPVMREVLQLTQPLLQDSSEDVRAFAASIHVHTPGLRPQTLAPPEATRSAATFSRPPPPAPS